jgi:hypothetical protein
MTTRYLNATANQHYISQVEQRLNARNPKAKPSNQCIYSLSLVDRDAFTLALDPQEGRLISTNLSLRDLFSFDVLPNNARKNYEEAFKEYEGTMRNNTVSLLKKLDQGPADIKEEILAIFVAKFMNFLRNPYSIKKALDTVGGITRFEPTDPDLLTQFNAVLTGSKPHQDHLCAELGITTDEYRMWLASLFMMLMRPKPQEPNLMELTVKQLFERPSGFPMVCVYRYTGEHADKRCLISDRGFSNPLPQELHLSFSFNLCANAFIVYIFGEIENIQLPFRLHPSVIELYKTHRKNVKVVPFVNDLDALARYNRNVIYQCHHSVYSSSKQVYGATIK